MKRVPTRFAATVLLLGLAMLSACANDSGSATGAEAQSRYAAPAPGGFVVHMGGSVNAAAAVR
jgi:hypothetical protein